MLVTEGGLDGRKCSLTTEAGRKGHATAAAAGDLDPHLRGAPVQARDKRYWAFADHYETRKSPDHHRAIDLWLQHHGTRIICCLVDFHSVDLSEMPSIYLASTVEDADKLHEVTPALGAPLIYEAYERRPETVGGHKLMRLPSEWSFSEARIKALAAHPRHLVERHEVFTRQQWSGTH